MDSMPGIQKKVVAELVGTFVFVLVGAGSTLGTFSLGLSDPASGLIVAAVANGLGLAMAVSATMAISGGVLNPAVALGLVVGKKLKLEEAALYILAEIAGAVAAGSALVISFPSAIGSPVHWGAPSLAGSISAEQGVGIEALLTFVLVIAVYGTAVDARAPHIGGLGIGLAVVADVLVAGPLTGAAMNPARATGPMLAGWFIPGYWYVYWVGPMIGAVIAGLVYRFGLESRQ